MQPENQTKTALPQLLGIKLRPPKDGCDGWVSFLVAVQKYATVKFGHALQTVGFDITYHHKDIIVNAVRTMDADF